MHKHTLQCCIGETEALVSFFLLLTLRPNNNGYSSCSLPSFHYFTLNTPHRMTCMFLRTGSARASCNPPHRHQRPLPDVLTLPPPSSLNLHCSRHFPALQAQPQRKTDLLLLATRLERSKLNPSSHLHPSQPTGFKTPVFPDFYCLKVNRNQRRFPLQIQVQCLSHHY